MLPTFPLVAHSLVLRGRKPTGDGHNPVTHWYWISPRYRPIPKDQVSVSGPKNPDDVRVMQFFLSLIVTKSH